MGESEQNGSFETTEGLPLLWQLAASPDNIVLRSVDGELENMEYYESEYRWPAVQGWNGSVTVTVPHAGTFHPAVVVYDRAEKGHKPPPSQPSYEVSVDGRAVGSFSPEEKDNRQRLYYLKRAVDLEAGARITVRTGPDGRHLIEDILLLCRPPPIRDRNFDIENVEARYVEQDGQRAMSLTWTTTWPALCTVEYGPHRGAKGSEQEEGFLANHRIHLEDLEPGERYRYRIIAPVPRGGEVRSGWKAFVFTPPALPAGTTSKAALPLRVENPYDFPVEANPVTSGVPFGRGELSDAANLQVQGPDGKPVLTQARVSGRWDDGSAKWVLLSFKADVPASQTAEYRLEYGTNVRRSGLDTPLSATREGEELTVDTGPLQVVFDVRRSGLPVCVTLNGRDVSGPGVHARLVDTTGSPHTSDGIPGRLEIEEEGPVRVVVRSAGHHRSDSGGRSFSYDCRFVFHADEPSFRVYYAWGNDGDDLFARFRSVSLRLPLGGSDDVQWAVGLGDGNQTSGSGDLELDQLRHDSFECRPAPPEGAEPRRADGWMDVNGGEAGVMIAVRDFWKLYPRSLSVLDGVVEAGVSSDVPDGFYGGDDERDGVNLTFYLQDGSHKIKRGVVKWHEMLFLFHQDVPGHPAHLRAAALFDEPPIAVCSPEHYCETGVFGRLLPAGTDPTGRYDRLCEAMLDDFLARRESEGWYGALNFGDMLGAGNGTWLNGEYDHHHVFALQFARTGDRKWLFLAEKAARHAIDVDTCHHGPDAGGVWAHALGHTGDYYERDPLKGNNHPRGIKTPSHTWTEGFADWYFLSGDRTALDNARLVGDYHAGAHLNNYDYDNCRDSGWHLILIMAVYNLTGDSYYLNAARIIVERVLERQTPGPRGWHRQMIPAHCYCTPRHRGACVYMLATLCRGLETYYEATGDEQAADAVVGGADQALDEMWVEAANSFSATSCPKSGTARKARPDTIHYTPPGGATSELAPLYMGAPVQMLLFAHLRTGRPHYADIARRSIEETFNFGAPYIGSIPWWSKALYYLDRIGRGHGVQD